MGRMSVAMNGNPVASSCNSIGCAIHTVQYSSQFVLIILIEFDLEEKNRHLG